MWCVLHPYVLLMMYISHLFSERKSYHTTSRTAVITLTWRIYMICFQKLKVSGIVLNFIVLYNITFSWKGRIIYFYLCTYMWCVNKIWNDLDSAYDMCARIFLQLNVHNFVTPASYSEGCVFKLWPVTLLSFPRFIVFKYRPIFSQILKWNERTFD